MNTNMTVQESRSAELGGDNGDNSSSAAQGHQAPAMAYWHDGNLKAEAACDRCLDRFTWTNEQRCCITRALELIAVLEEYEGDNWYERTGSCSSKSRDDLRRMWRSHEHAGRAPGFYALDSWEIRLIHGALMIAQALGVALADEPDVVTRVQDQIRDFHIHLHNHHRRNGTCTVPQEIRKQLKQPLFIGHLDLPKAVQLSDRLRGRTLEQISAWCKQQLDGLLEEIRGNIAKSHGGRPETASVLEAALWNSLHAIESQAAEWLDRGLNSIHCEDLMYLAQEIHEQIFLVDELLAMGCWSELSRSTNGMHQLRRAIEKIEHLVDWDECPVLYSAINGSADKG